MLNENTKSTFIFNLTIDYPPLKVTNTTFKKADKKVKKYIKDLMKQKNKHIGVVSIQQQIEL